MIFFWHLMNPYRQWYDRIIMNDLKPFTITYPHSHSSHLFSDNYLPQTNLRQGNVFHRHLPFCPQGDNASEAGTPTFRKADLPIGKQTPIWIPWDTFNKLAVRILLECILVFSNVAYIEEGKREEGERSFWFNLFAFCLL